MVEQMEELLTPKELCKMYKISMPTIYKGTSLNLIPHIKVGGRIRFREADLLKWEKQNTNRYLSKRVPTTKLL